MAGMSLTDFAVLAKLIQNHHSLTKGELGGRRIKYVRCSYDTRTDTVFGITLDNKNFTVVNENRKRDLKKWVMAYLHGTTDGFDPIRDDPEIDWANILKGKKPEEDPINDVQG